MPRRLVPVLALAAFASCRSPDPRQVLELKGLETYWVVDAPMGATHYISPAVRFRVYNKGSEPIRSIQATANFRRVGEKENWGSAWEQVTPAKSPLAPGKDVLVVLRSDGRYTSTGGPESMFQHELFKDARTEVFVRVGSSGWVKMAEAPIERRFGARSVQDLAAP